MVGDVLRNIWDVVFDDDEAGQGHGLGTRKSKKRYMLDLAHRNDLPRF